MEFNFKFFQDLIVGNFTFLVTMLLLVIVSNRICKLLENIRIPLMILLFIQLLLIIGFLYILRYYLGKMITDKELFNSILSLAGPIIAVTSLYFSPILKSINNSLLWN